MREGGFSFLEAALVLGVAGLALAVALPALGRALSRGRVAAAAREMATEMARLRGEAIAGRHKVAMRVSRPGGRYEYSFYADGDGDGVRADDIVAGRDRRIGGPRDLRSRYEGVDFGLLEQAIPEIPPGRGALAPGTDPIRFGRSDMISFSPAGTSSSGTLYVSDGRGEVRAVVLYGRSARIRIWRFDREVWRWSRSP